MVGFKHFLDYCLMIQRLLVIFVISIFSNLRKFLLIIFVAIGKELFELLFFFNGLPVIVSNVIHKTWTKLIKLLKAIGSSQSIWD